MTKDNENQDIKNKKNKRRKKGTFFKSFKIFLVLLLLIVVIAGGALGGIVISIIKDTPEIDPTKINSSLSQTSTIYDSNDKLIEKMGNDIKKFIANSVLSFKDYEINKYGDIAELKES